MKNVYFLSDAHLGSRAIEHGRTQERRLVNFLDSIKHKASAVYLLGDMFDFWYEFQLVVPKGYTRFWKAFRTDRYGCGSAFLYR